MNAQHRQIIKDNRSILAKNIHLNEKLIQYLQEYKIFNKYMWKDINNVCDMLDLLPSRGPKAFQNFIEILRKTNYNEEAGLLEKPTLSVEITDDLFYRMSSTPLGYCLIINNVEFYCPKQGDEPVRKSKLCYREGSDVDAERLRNFFEKVGFDVTTERNLTCDQMQQCFEAFSEKEFMRVDSMILIILSHGGQMNNKDYVYGTDEGIIYKNDIIHVFNNEKCGEIGLQSKPKIFFFIACRGEGRDYGVPKILPKESIDSTNDVLLPFLSDIFVVHSSLPYQVSVRNHENGSYFCEALVSVLNDYHKTYDLETMIKLVNIKLERKVSELYRIIQVAHTENLGGGKKAMLCRRN